MKTQMHGIKINGKRVYNVDDFRAAAPELEELYHNYGWDDLSQLVRYLLATDYYGELTDDLVRSHYSTRLDTVAEVAERMGLDASDPRLDTCDLDAIHHLFYEAHPELLMSGRNLFAIFVRELANNDAYYCIWIDPELDAVIHPTAVC